MRNTITFATIEQAVIFKYELLGQFSDGHWENTRPHDHWQVWSDANIVVGPNPGRDFYVIKDNYSLTAKLLLDAVGDRMIRYVKLVRAFDLRSIAVLDYVREDGTAPDYPGKFWDGVRADLAKYDLARVSKILAADTYTMKDLRRDLRAISATMRNKAA